jgi:Uma2 family endonuclease
MAIRLYDLMLAADEAGIKLEWVQGNPTWEAFPALRHQRVVERISRSIKPSAERGDGGCKSETVRDVYIKFPDGSIKRPDLAIFCHEVADTDEAIAVVPDAVVEVVSRGFEKKDLEIGPPFYLSQGVKDLLVVDLDGKGHHFTAQGVKVYDPSTRVELNCGCVVVV